jgi:D-alanyl-D-alanine carboxypeptidase
MIHRRLMSLCLAMAFGLAGLLTVGPTPIAAASFTDIAASPFRAQIEWLAGEGITSGCGDGRFCPDGLVTRAQMASFLVRMFELPASGVDRFDDDTGSRHEAAINALAAAGITAGCGPRAYCPSGIVTRAQMATFLSRAADLPATSLDYFLDDEESTHESRLNRVAAAGLTAGCGFHRVCPAGSVTRGQMAAFLYRVERPLAAPPDPLPDAGPLPVCRYDDVLTPRHAFGDWPSSLLDTTYMLPETFVPPDLDSTSSAGANGGYRIRHVALADFAALVSAASASDHPIRVVSAYRSYATQETTFAHWVAVAGEAEALRRSARPGHSEHQLGTTLDITHAGGSAPWIYSDWAAHPTGAWMRDNAWRYGFVMSYPKGASSKSCYDYEPWHYRYVGRDMAREVRMSGLTLREWLWRVYGP